jgi:hypothetical protein
MSGLDLNNLDAKAAAESGARIELIDPRNGDPLVDDAGKPYYVDLIGTDSAKLRAISKRVVERRVTDIRKGRNVDYDADAEAAERVKLYAAATIGWYLPTLDGQQLEFSEKVAKSLYADERFPWLVEQIDKAIADRQRFFKKASAS